ncbi:MAG: NAD-dependent epimerase/dehydratase family protein [Dehalococcoidia bacterium]|nr:NAD-dependent epimerase/dehydratase family protein [Dehalococcoidia bacterium]
MTNHPPSVNSGLRNPQDPLWGHVAVHPLNFRDPNALTTSLRGATTLYNTYWVRFPMGKATFDTAVENSKVLIRAAQESGVRRLVHISIANASADSPLPYYRGKGLVEETIITSGLSYAIFRPTVIFGEGDILINNIAWLLRRFLVFAIPGSGEYRLQPVFVEDVADLAASLGEKNENIVTDAAGPETYTYDELVRLLAEAVGSRAKIVHVSPWLALLFGKLLGYLVRDVVITGDEIRGLMDNLLISHKPPTGRTLFSDWLRENAERLGASYASEVGKRR